LSFVSLSWSIITDKLAINWQNFARVRLQLKFAFIIDPRPVQLYKQVPVYYSKMKQNYQI